MVSLVGLASAVVMIAVGTLVIVVESDAGEASVLPAASLARTEKVTVVPTLAAGLKV